MKLVLTTFILALLVSNTSLRSQQNTQRVNVVGKRFEFTPAEITVEKGKPVTLLLTSEDVTHGLAIKDLNVKIEAKKGQTAQATFTPTQSGDFPGKCSHFCGRQHGKMKFVVHVQ